MPKQIENLQDRILETAKCELLESDYSRFTIRSVAKKCGIAVGTIYNYFTSKDILAASVMLKDWNEALFAMRQGSGTSISITEGLYVIYIEIGKFNSLYKGVWSQFSYTSQFASEYSKRHDLLLEQLAGIIHTLILRFHIAEDKFLENFIAENLLLAAMKQSDFQPLAAIFDRILIKSAYHMRRKEE